MLVCMRRASGVAAAALGLAGTRGVLRMPCTGGARAAGRGARSGRRVQPQAALRLRSQPERRANVEVHDGGGGVQQICATKNTLLMCAEMHPAVGSRSKEADMNLTADHVKGSAEGRLRT